jgi:hypothetical protein
LISIFSSFKSCSSDKIIADDNGHDRGDNRGDDSVNELLERGDDDDNDDCEDEDKSVSLSSNLKILKILYFLKMFFIALSNLCFFLSYIIIFNSIYYCFINTISNAVYSIDIINI